MSGRSFNTQFLFVWPSAKIAVMGSEQAAKTLSEIKASKMSQVDDETKKKLYNQIKEQYEKQSDCRYAAARMWIDEIILPNKTRKVLIEALDVINHQDEVEQANFGILQV